jgi:hypothetical protein
VVTYAPNGNYNGTDSFTYTVTDDGTTNGSADHKSDTATVNVTVTAVNDAPVVTSGGAVSGTEGTPVTVTATFTDVESDNHTATINWGDGNITDASISGDQVFGAHAYADNGSWTATVQVTDDGSTNGVADVKSGSTTAAVTIGNVAPTVATPSVSYDPATGMLTMSATFSDPGVPDTFPYGSFSIPGQPGSPIAGVITRNANGGGGSVTASTKLQPGCYNLSIKASVTDDDGGSGTSATPATLTNADVYAASFKDPIRDGERNIAKYGNVVPVKVQLTSSCTGITVTNVTLHLTIVQGDVSDDNAADSNIVAESVSNADTGTQMRVSGLGYIYNLSTKSMLKGKDYTIRVRSGSATGPILLKALFQPK